MLLPLRPSADPATRWPHLELPFIGAVALGNVTQWRFMIGWEEESETLHVAILTKGYAIFRGAVDPHEVAVAFDKMPMCDACNVADLVNAQVGIDTNYGRYDDGLCRGSADA